MSFDVITTCEHNLKRHMSTSAISRWKKDTQWAGGCSTFCGVQLYANLRNIAHDGSDNFNSIQIAYDAG